MTLSAGQTLDMTDKVVKITNIEKVKKNEDGKNMRKQEVIVSE